MYQSVASGEEPNEDWSINDEKVKVENPVFEPYAFMQPVTGSKNRSPSLFSANGIQTSFILAQ